MPEFTDLQSNEVNISEATIHRNLKRLIVLVCTQQNQRGNH